MNNKINNAGWEENGVVSNGGSRTEGGGHWLNVLHMHSVPTTLPGYSLRPTHWQVHWPTGARDATGSKTRPSLGSGWAGTFLQGVARWSLPTKARQEALAIGLD